MDKIKDDKIVWLYENTKNPNNMGPSTFIVGKDFKINYNKEGNETILSKNDDYYVLSGDFRKECRENNKIHKFIYLQSRDKNT